MTLITAAAPAAATGVGKIGYKNFYAYATSTITASTEATGFEKENAYDWFGYSYWKPTATGDSWIKVQLSSAQTGNYCAVWGHDLADHSSSIKVQYSTDDISWTDLENVAPSDNTTIFISFADTDAVYWRLLVNNPTTISSISGVQIGESLDLPYNMDVGFEPPSLVPIVELKTARSESGSFIGGSQLNQGVKSSFSLSNLDPAWVRSDWIPFTDHAKTPKPFVFAWDDVNHGSEVVLAWTPKQIKTPSYTTPLRMKAMLDFEGTL